MKKKASAIYHLIGGLVLAIIFNMLASAGAEAARACPKGQTHKSYLCYDIVEKANGTREAYPVGKSYKRDETWVIDERRDTMYQKGKSYDVDEFWEIDNSLDEHHF